MAQLGDCLSWGSTLNVGRRHHGIELSYPFDPCDPWLLFRQSLLAVGLVAELPYRCLAFQVELRYAASDHSPARSLRAPKETLSSLCIMSGKLVFGGLFLASARAEEKNHTGTEGTEKGCDLRHRALSASVFQRF